MSLTLSSYFACATCIPNSDARIAMAGNSAILVMLIMLVIVLGSIFSFIIYLMRRAQSADAALDEQVNDSSNLPTSQ